MPLPLKILLALSLSTAGSAQARWKLKDLDPSNRNAGIRKVAAKADPTTAVRHLNDRLFQHVGRGLASSAGFRSQAEGQGWTLQSCQTLGAGVALPIITLKASAMCAAILAGELISATTCATTLLASTGTLVIIACTQLCHDHHLKDCK